MDVFKDSEKDVKAQWGTHEIAVPSSLNRASKAPAWLYLRDFSLKELQFIYKATVYTSLH